MDSTLFDGIIHKIRAKNREDYEQVVFSSITDLRIWIQENAEKAALVFLAIGFLLPFLFKLVLLCIGFAALAAFVVWTVALPAGIQPAGASPAGVSASGFSSGMPPRAPGDEASQDETQSTVVVQSESSAEVVQGPETPSSGNDFIQH